MHTLALGKTGSNIANYVWHMITGGIITLWETVQFNFSQWNNNHETRDHPVFLSTWLAVYTAYVHNVLLFPY